MAQVLHACKVGKRAFRAEIGHILGSLQGTGGRKYLAPDGPQMILRQGAGVARSQTVQHFLFPQGLEDNARHVGLDTSHLKAQGRPLVKEREQILIHGVNLVADGGKARARLIGRGCLTVCCGYGVALGPVAVAVVHAISPGCLRGCACQNGGRLRPGGTARYRRASGPLRLPVRRRGWSGGWFRHSAKIPRRF